MNQNQKDAWKNALKKNSMKPGKAMNSHVSKGIGPNKASGRKGGISRQGSKRG